MKMPWERSKEEKRHDSAEIEDLQVKLSDVMDSVRRALDEVEQSIEEDLRRG